MLRLATICACLLAAPAMADDLTVFAAASLRDALSDVAERYEAETGTDITLSFAGSGLLARQIGLGAPADVFVSANTEWMDVLDADGDIAPDSRRDILQNSLVLVAPAPAQGVDLTAEALTGALGPDGYLAMGVVTSVPAGIYGKAAFEHLGIWPRLEGRVAQADNVRAALALVATGEAPLGVVYATDAKADDRVAVVARFPDESHAPIRYPAARVTRSEAPDADAFLAYLTGETARGIFADYGFDAVEDTP